MNKLLVVVDMQKDFIDGALGTPQALSLIHIWFLCEHGFVVLINDHRGHGQSVRTKDDLGYFYENGGEALVEDLHQLTGWVKERYPDLPFFLFGHSMGSLAVRAYTKNCLLYTSRCV